MQGGGSGTEDASLYTLPSFFYFQAALQSHEYGVTVCHGGGEKLGFKAAGKQTMEQALF